ncbi:MAG: hypothetical protein EOP46_20905, partial [Sphingobacteriaceae bacterium]
MFLGLIHQSFCSSTGITNPLHPERVTTDSETATCVNWGGLIATKQSKKIPHSLLTIHYFTILATFKRNMNKFFGTGVAMVTPFQADGQVDYDGL